MGSVGEKGSIIFTVLVLQLSELVNKGSICVLFICVVVKTCEKTCYFFLRKSNSAVKRDVFRRSV